MAIEYTPESSLVADPAEGGSFSTSNNAELAGAQSFAAKAKLSETAAATSETNSANSATASANSATASSTSATQSADSATASATSATQSATSATASATSATASANSATAAATSETNAGTSATTATTKASEASTSATNAATSETNAGTSATAASNSATAASTSATSASGSATTATTKASEASTSETNAGTSATASATSATASANSATAAATSATNAGTSETAAATSATNAATSATASANSATASAGSATSSSNSATSAATAQTAAEAARDAALASFDSFDDRYLGQKTSDPSTDNDGNALVAGTLYFNTSTDAMMVYEGSSWVAAYASLSGALIANNNLSDLNNAATARTNLGLGTIATADSTDYVLTTGGTFTGNVESPEFIGTLQGEVVFKAKAGEAITKGDAVYVSGISGNTPVVSKADADDAAKMPAFGLSADTVSANAAMEVVILGQLTNMDTSGYTLGDTLYISNTPGVLSATKPAGESSQLQNIGKVERVHASTGSILVSGSGRSAATPNLNDGQFFLGNGSNQAASTDFTTSVLGEISAGTGIGISGGGVISNSAPDQTVALTGAGATSISGTYPNFTITSTDTNTDTNTTYTAGTGITLTGTEFSIGQGVATTDSPAFAGLTVDTTTLAVDSTNNRVGIGTSSPSAPLHVQKGSAGSSAFPSGDWAAKIFNQTDASTENGLVVANRWAAAASTAFEVGGLLDNGDGFDTFLKVDGSGQVGIGTASPTRALDIVGDIGISGRIKPTAAAGTTTAAAPRICLGYDWDTGFFQDTTNTIGFATAGSEAMRILADGKVGIGQTAPSSLLHIGDAGTPSPQLFIETTDGGGTPTGASLIASSSTGDVTLQNVSPSPNTKLNFNAATTTFQRSGSEKMRINTYGVGIGTTSPGLALDVEGQCRVEDSQSYGGMVSRISLTGGSYGYGLYVNNSSLGGTGTTAQFTTTSTAKNVAFSNGGTTSIFATFNKYNSSAAGHIRMSSNVLQYQVLSDARAKENIVDAGDAGSKIDAIQVRQFDWIEGGLHEEFGFIAQELAPIVPLAVGGEPDGEEMMGVDASKLVPLLVKEIQSLRARVAALEE